MSIKKVKNHEVTTARPLTNAFYFLTLLEERVIRYGIAHARSSQTGLDSTKSLVFTVADFAAFWEMPRSSAYGVMKAAIEQLYSRTLRYRETINGKEAETETRWIQTKSYLSGEGEIHLKFSADVVRNIVEIQDGLSWTRYNLAEIKGFTSVYATKLYCWAMQFKSSGWITVSHEDLRRVFGISDDSYTEKKLFNRNIVKKSIKQINDFSDYVMTEKPPLKKGRTITHYRFSLSLKPEFKTTAFLKKAIKSLSPNFIHEMAQKMGQGKTTEQVIAKLTETGQTNFAKWLADAPLFGEYKPIMDYYFEQWKEGHEHNCLAAAHYLRVKIEQDAAVTINEDGEPVEDNQPKLDF
jgi:hypothetical protein